VASAMADVDGSAFCAVPRLCRSALPSPEQATSPTDKRALLSASAQRGPRAPRLQRSKDMPEAYFARTAKSSRIVAHLGSRLPGRSRSCGGPWEGGDRGAAKPRCG
jgi:hypothetical protein